MAEELRKKVVIIGAGFGGLNAAQELSDSNFDVTIIDRNNYHTFFPLLYQVSAAEIEPEQIAAPVRLILRKFKNVKFIRGEVSRINYKEKTVTCLGEQIPFDYLIVAVGSVNAFFNVPGAEKFTFPLKTLDDGMILRNHILTCFERASFISDPIQRTRLLTIAIIGGGPTGVEFAGALAELVYGPLKKDFPELSKDSVRIVLIEGSKTLIGMFDERLSKYVARTLQRKGIEVRIGVAVKRIDKKGIILESGEIVETETVVWTAGVRGEMIPNDLRIELQPNGRVKVDEYLRIPGYRDIFVVGDLACAYHEGKALPMIAPVAMQQGRYVGDYLKKLSRGKRTAPFRYRDKGSMVTVGRNQAVSQIGALKMKGYFAWIIWIFIHILYLIGFRNKLFVMINWIFDYIFFEKSVRLILPRCCDNPMHIHCIARRCGENYSKKQSNVKARV
ncbi:MAG: NAD(P)/FAD-dependent oxidoreductase [Spirochaetes bacterium]|nr:NAD(P)/FAD-dependent oxidoreductase [Spirochaetota bacterium]